MFYAEFCPYGIHTISDGDTLMAFETREERNEMVERIHQENEEQRAWNKRKSEILRELNNR